MDAAFAVLFIILGLSWGFIFAVACSYVAAQRGRDGFTWGVLGFFLGIVALLILMAIPVNEERRAAISERGPSQARRPRFCSNCGMRLGVEANFCSGCGTAVQARAEAISVAATPATARRMSGPTRQAREARERATNIAAGGLGVIVLVGLIFAALLLRGQ